MVSMVASLPLRRRGFTHGYDSSRIHAPLYRLHAQHSADRSAGAHRSSVSARDRPSGGFLNCVLLVFGFLRSRFLPNASRGARKIFDLSPPSFSAHTKTIPHESIFF